MKDHLGYQNTKMRGRERVTQSFAATFRLCVFSAAAGGAYLL